VSLHRYSLAMEWEKSLRELTWGAPPSPTSSSSTGGSAAAVSLSQQEQQQQPEDASSKTALTASAAAAADQAAGAAGGTGPSGSAVGGSWGKVPPQNRPIVAVVTAAGAIMQSAGPDTGREMVASNKLVRVLRGYRENPQVGGSV
jgi:hypothetical protein